jgi:NAD(P)-dependent dehydrogenase (short-subunit alcohol dehydrogenase family)
MRALLTGGTGKLGAALAERLRAAGWSVVAPGRRDGDVARPDEARALVERAVAELGGLDVLVNGAGAGFTPRPVADVSESDWDDAFGATAKGSFFVTQSAAPHLAAGGGLVIMLEDVAGLQPWPSFAPHSAAKAALQTERPSNA